MQSALAAHGVRCGTRERAGMCLQLLPERRQRPLRKPSVQPEVRAESQSGHDGQKKPQRRAALAAVEHQLVGNAVQRMDGESVGGVTDLCAQGIQAAHRGFDVLGKLGAGDTRRAVGKRSTQEHAVRLRFRQVYFKEKSLCQQSTFS